MRIVIGNLKEVLHPDTLVAAFAEFISMFVFVFAVKDVPLHSANTLMSQGARMQGGGFISAAISHAFSLFVAVSIATNISGGHVNPAVTFGVFFAGYITFYRSVLYLIAQLLGSVVALFLLKFATVEQHHGMQVFFEIVMTFGLVYIVYATTIDPKRSDTECIAPIIIGFFVGANTLAGGGIYGAAMNPAMAFGQAVDSRKWESHRIYRLGPFVGAAILCFDFLTIFVDSRNTHWPLPAERVEKDYLKEHLIEVEKAQVINITL
ncbi:unnamed protein product [Withania somnifera]